VPTWAWRFLEHIVHHRVTKVGAALVEAGAESEFSDYPFVTIVITGSVRYGIYNLEIKWRDIDFYVP
jgi:hypothetical protein